MFNNSFPWSRLSLRKNLSKQKADYFHWCNHYRMFNSGLWILEICLVFLNNWNAQYIGIIILLILYTVEGGVFFFCLKYIDGWAVVMLIFSVQCLGVLSLIPWFLQRLATKDIPDSLVYDNNLNIWMSERCDRDVQNRCSMDRSSNKEIQYIINLMWTAIFIVFLLS